MQLPDSLQASIDQIVQRASPHALRKAQQDLTQQYQAREFAHSIFSDEAKRLAYLITRLPATFASVFKALEKVRQALGPFQCKSLLDLGAGPGTACLAALQLFPELERLVCVEKCPYAIALGKELLGGGEWICRDLQSKELLPEVDLAIASYSLGELKNPEEAIDWMWRANPGRLVIIEPGTPQGFALIRMARDRLIQMGAHLIAPCPHTKTCPMKEGNWCHFAARVERTSLHRQLKGGSLGHEDEKFSYVAVSKTPVASSMASRILRHPMKGSGHVRLTLCTPSGEEKEQVVSRKDKEAYRAARDAEWGDSFPY